MAAQKPKYYTVWKGKTPGVFSTWAECKASVEGFEGAQYKSFPTKEQATQALQGNYWQYVTKKSASGVASSSATAPLSQGSKGYIEDALAVDAACSGNPGDMEYQGVYVKNGKQVFHRGVYQEGTNNIGEFLAIVHGLALLKQKGLDMPIYSDSMTAQTWVRNKHCKTKLERTAANAPLFERIEAAEKWLRENTYTTKIYKWRTELWGEIPADFGRK